MATIEDLVRQTLYPRAEIVAGREGLDASVTWAVTARPRTPAIDPLQGGEIVLLPQPALRHLGGDGALASLIPSFRDGGAAGVCIWSEPTPTACAAADAAKLPLVHVWEAAPAELERELLDLIARQMRHGLRQQQDRQTHLLDTLASNRGLDGVVRVLAEAIGKPAAYFPANGVGVSFPEKGVKPPDGLWQRLTTEQTVIVMPAEQPGTYAYATPVLRGNSRIGALVAYGPEGRATTSDAQAMRQAAAAVAVETRRLDAAVEAQQRLRTEFYKDLFGGRATESLYTRARTLGVRLPDEARVAIVANLDEAHALPEAVKERLLASLTRTASYPVLDRGRELLMLLPATLRGESAEGVLARVLRAAGAGSAAGVSNPVRELANVAPAVEEAATALLVGRRTRNGQLTTLADSGAYGLLAPLRGTREARRMVEQLLGPLTLYDEQHGAALTQTLETYIACNGNVSVTAQKLSLHRNSLSYRLRRIEELSGLDLSESESRLLLTLALRLRRLW